MEIWVSWNGHFAEYFESHSIMFWQVICPLTDNPKERSQLLFDPNFDCSSADSQELMLLFCLSLFWIQLCWDSSRRLPLSSELFSFWVVVEVVGKGNVSNAVWGQYQNLLWCAKYSYFWKKFHDCMIVWRLEVEEKWKTLSSSQQ